jgi:hypothetical protein
MPMCAKRLLCTQATVLLVGCATALPDRGSSAESRAVADVTATADRSVLGASLIAFTAWTPVTPLIPLGGATEDER